MSDPGQVCDEDMSQDGEGRVEDAKVPKIMKTPDTPTKREYEEHMCTHLPYRTWCPHCVAGKGISSQHRRSQDSQEDAIGATISADYCFATPEDESAGSIPTLVMYDNKHGNIWPLRVKRKGVCQENVKWATGKLEEAGFHGQKLALKTDGEEAIMAFKKAVAAGRVGDTALIESPVRESKSNGAMERMVGVWAGQMRTLKHQLEANINKAVPADHPIMEWMTVWAGELLNKGRIKQDGRTPYEATTSHRCKHAYCRFGETVMFKTAMDKTNRHKLDSDWGIGAFLGVISRTTEFLIGNKSGIFKCRTIRKMTKEKAYDDNILDIIKVGYLEYIMDGARTTPPRVRFAEPESRKTSDNKDVIPRRLRLTPEDFATQGFTQRCPGCIWIQTKVGPRRGHTEDCRSRIEKNINETEEGKERMERTQDRLNHWLSERGPENADMEVSDPSASHPEVAAAPSMMNELEPEVVAAPQMVTTSDEATPGIKREATEPSTPDGRMAKKTRGPSDEITVEANQEMRDDMDNIEDQDQQDKKLVSQILAGVDVTEIYSPERVVRVCAKYFLKPGSSLDLTNGWDFTKAAHRKLAIERIEKENPELIIGSPPCTYFSTLQQFNLSKNKGNAEWLETFMKEKKKAIRHVVFCCLLYRMQMEKGKYFVHEHPWAAESWQLRTIQALEKDKRTIKVRGDMCQFGMTTRAGENETCDGPVLKPTGFLTNSWCIAEELDRRCPRNHAHVPLLNGKAAAAAVYPAALCEAFCRGLGRQKKYDKSSMVCTYKMNAVELAHRLGTLASLSVHTKDVVKERRSDSRRPKGDWPDHWKDAMHEEDGGGDRFGERIREGRQVLQRELNDIMIKEGAMTAWDDVTKEALDPDMVREARRVEMEFFDKMQVYTRVSRDDQRRTKGKIIRVRWIDHNKGDMDNPAYRSRLVGMEFKTGRCDELYASTPPLEALRMIVSWAATVDDGTRGAARRQVMVNDVSRAYFYAKCSRDIYVELPPEDPHYGKGLLGKLNLSLYGTRDAALNWQNTLSKHLVSIGFLQGVGHPSLFHHPRRGIHTLVHGDDYTSSGYKEDLDWMEQELAKEYAIKSQRIGPNGGVKEGKVLNRVIRYEGNRWEIEADQRHAELIVEKLGLSDCNGVTTPGSDQTEKDAEQHAEEPLDGEQATFFRGLAARCNYLSMDRPELQFSVKELCRDMSSPTKGSMIKLKRIGRFLKLKPRLVWKFFLQMRPKNVDIHVDADWAGCRATRKSTSGGAMSFGAHPIKTWSKTQAVIAKSSAESEFYGVIKGACEGLGMASLCKDQGEEIEIQMHMDALAAKGIIERRGLSRVRHIDIDTLWLQEQQARKLLPMTKVKGTENTADLMTKHISAAEIEKYLNMMNMEFRSGRAETTSNLHSVDAMRKDSWDARGHKGTWVRRHNAIRQALFTPFRVPKGPKRDSLGEIRKTEGEYVDGGKFVVIDMWKQPESSHSRLPRPWTGKTTFYEHA